MALTYRSSIPESFTIIGTDADGRQRVATATRHSGDFNWRLNLRHPSGEFWEGSYRAPGGSNAGVIDALGELMRQKDQAFKIDKARGDRPPPAPRDTSRSVDANVAPISAFAWRTK